MKFIKPISITLIILLSLGACSRKVTRVDTDEQIDLSGRWNDTDSRLVSKELVKNVLSDKWLAEFVEKEGRRPVVIVGFVKNKSDEHIEAETFVKDIERAFVESGQVRLVQGGEKREAIRTERADQQNNASVSTMKKWGLEIGADFMMFGSINSIKDSYKKKTVASYQINMELNNIQTNEVVWIGKSEQKKFVKN